MWYDEYIECVPGVQGGYPIVAGTRTPVRTIVLLAHRTYQDEPERVAWSLPHLTERQIEAALAYYRDHPSTVDEDIERQEKLMHDLLIAQ